MSKTKIAIFASGTGSNAVNLIHVGFVLSNKADAPVLKSSETLGVRSVYFDNAKVADGDFLTTFCKDNNVDWIILAGYLRLIPRSLITAYSEKMINLHPSLLPNHGGKGMFGTHVHKAVIANNETESGITIHFVSPEFDKGRIIAQFHCALTPQDGVSELEQKIRYLEQAYLPTVIQNTILT